jgi:OOP family OmpA-OmpF porin
MRTVLLVLALLTAPALADSKGKLVTVTDTAIVLRDPVYFAFGPNPSIKKESYAILDALAATIKADKHLALIEIQGHTDERGDDRYNLEVSDKRAHLIEAYLVGHGVEPKRLTAKGYGESQPLDKGHNEKAWAKNRRTAFVILQRMT